MYVRSTLLWLLVFALLVAGCAPQTDAVPTIVATPGRTLSAADVQYALIDHFGGVFYCDPDFYPVGRPGVEEQRTQEQFPTIQADAQRYAAILQHLGLEGVATLSDAQKLLGYREHKRLNAVQVTPADGSYTFKMRVGEGQGSAYEGTVTSQGRITVTKKETSFNTCPICLAVGTLIDTPAGPVPVQSVRPGMPVWTLNGSGERVASLVLRTVARPASPGQTILRIRLADGRELRASPGHTTVEGQPLAEVRPGGVLDGATVTAVERVPYDGEMTYDILPAGDTGFYWADGVLIGSTLTGEH